MTPLLSIITASFNSGKTIEETIVSVINQNYTDFEYIIVDGKSTDNTLNIIKKYEPLFNQKNISFKWISESDTGIYNAWNKGLKIATGSWISFLGSDDIYLENVLEKYSEKILLNKEADFIHSKVKLMNNNKVKHVFSDVWKWQQFKRYMKIAHVGSFHNKEYFEAYGDYDENYKITGDYELLLRAKDKLKTVFFDDFTAEMKDGGVSNINVIKAFKEAKKAKINTANISLVAASFDFYFSLFKYYLSTFVKRILN
jgi:glycosyltransferase involved in cell wall biosynthesis